MSNVRTAPLRSMAPAPRKASWLVVAVAFAFTESVNWVALRMEAIVALAGTPSPTTAVPTVSPAVLVTVTVLFPLVVEAVITTPSCDTAPRFWEVAVRLPFKVKLPVPTFRTGELPPLLLNTTPPTVWLKLFRSNVAPPRMVTMPVLAIWLDAPRITWVLRSV